MSHFEDQKQRTFETKEQLKLQMRQQQNLLKDSLNPGQHMEGASNSIINSNIEDIISIQPKCDHLSMIQGTLTLDSNLKFCQMADIATTGCCEKPEERQSGLFCNPITNCCETIPDCVFLCMKDGKFEECRKKCRILSAQINHNRYYK